MPVGMLRRPPRSIDIIHFFPPVLSDRSHSAIINCITIFSAVFNFTGDGKCIIVKKVENKVKKRRIDEFYKRKTREN